MRSSILTWTYLVSDKLKVVIMGNGYDVLGCEVLDTFLLTRSVQLKRVVILRRTNLYNIVQNPDERVTILVPRRQTFFHHHLTRGEHVHLNHLKYVSLVSHPPDDCQGRQGGVLLQLELVWPRRRSALLGNP